MLLAVMYPRPHPHQARRLIILLVILVALAAGGIAFLIYVLPVLSAVQSATGQTVPTPAPQVQSSGQPALNFTPAPVPTPPSLSGSTPINVLLLGSDTDPKFTGVYDTQIMIVVTINPALKRVSMLSIPRDLWVPIPGLGMGKVGTAYHAGGVALARETIERDFGIPIHYYAWVGLDGFIKVIDTFGGVDVDVSHPIVDDAYPDDVNSPDPYAYRRLYIPAGPQHLDGTRALEYVRSRHGDLIGDFGRSQRQQQVLDAIRSKTSGRAIIANLPKLATDLKDSVRTDMTLPDLVQFAAFADQIRGQKIGQYTLAPPSYSVEGNSQDGQSIVIPRWPEIRGLVDQLFGLDTRATLPSLSIAGVAVASPAPAASGTAHAGTPRPTGTVEGGAAHGTPVRPSGTTAALPVRSGTPTSAGVRRATAATATRAPVSREIAPVATRPAA